MEDSEDGTSLQRLGDADVLVTFERLSSNGSASVLGAFVNGELVDASYFSDDTLARWERAITSELDEEKGDYLEAQREA